MENVILIIILAAIAGGSVPPFAKMALEVFQPFTLVMIRFFFASLILLPFIHKKNELNITKFKELFCVATIGALNPILLFIALQFTQSSVAPLIYASVPSMTAIYIALYKKQKISRERFVGIIVGFIGVGLIILLPLFSSGGVDVSGLSGNLLIFFAAVAFLTYGLLSKDKQRRLKVSPIALTFYFALVTFMVSIPFSAYELFSNPVDMSTVQLRHILSALEVGIVGTSVFYLSYQQALKLSSELTAALFTYLQPVATVFFAVILLNEVITLPFVIGGVLAVYGARKASSG